MPHEPKRPYQKGRVSPSSPEEIALISKTYVVYHPDGIFEIWYGYPAGFVAGTAPEDSFILLTDPTEEPPPGFVPEYTVRYVARADRQFGYTTPYAVYEHFSFLWDRKPSGMIAIPRFLSPDSQEIPAICPTPNQLPRGWEFVTEKDRLPNPGDN